MEPGAPGGTPLAMRVRETVAGPQSAAPGFGRAGFAVAVMLLVALLAGVPPTALAAARWAAASGTRAGLARAGRHQVSEVLLHDAPTTGGSRSFPSPEPNLLARWPSPAGPRTGNIGTRPGARAGRAATVRVDRPCRLAGPVAPAAGVARHVLAAVLAAPVTLSVLLLVLWAYARIVLDWRPMAAWDADWAATEPQWTGRR